MRCSISGMVILANLESVGLLGLGGGGVYSSSWLMVLRALLGFLERGALLGGDGSLRSDSFSNTRAAFFFFDGGEVVGVGCQLL